MAQSNNRILHKLSERNCSLFSTFVFASSLALSLSSHAHNFDLGYGQLEQQVTLQNETLTLNPAGLSAFLSLDLSPDWSFSVNYQSMNDDKNENQLNVDVELVSYGGSINYYRDNWFFSAGLSAVDDEQDVSVDGPGPGDSEEYTQSTTLSTTLGYGWNKGNWLYDFSVGAQYSDWDIDTVMEIRQPGQRPETQSSSTSDNSVSINTSVSLGHYWAMSDNRGLLAGAMLSWSYILSGDSLVEQQNSTGGRGGGRNGGGPGAGPGVGTSSGDDNYGQFLLYLSYDLNDVWSLSLDGATEIASDYSGQSWSVNLGYAF